MSIVCTPFTIFYSFTITNSLNLFTGGGWARYFQAQVTKSGEIPDQLREKLRLHLLKTLDSCKEGFNASLYLYSGHI
jgi:hypothetical protein